MKSLENYIYEAKIANLTEFEQAWLDWFIKHSKEGKLPIPKEDIKQKLIDAALYDYSDEIEYFENSVDKDYYFLEDLLKFIKKNNIEIEGNTPSKKRKYLQNRFDDEYFEDVINDLFIDVDKDKFDEWYRKYLTDRFFGDMNDIKVDPKSGLIKIVRTVALPKELFSLKHYSNYAEYLENYYSGVGIYWSFTSGGVYCFQNFEDDKLVAGENQVRLDIYALTPYESIDRGSTFRQLSGGFSSETEITIIDDAEIEVYKLEIKDGDKKYKLPLKSPRIAKA